MSIIKSYAVGNGDMFHIEHNSDNFTIIDCCLSEGNEQAILHEIASVSSSKGVKRFISTHPDDDHIRGLELLDDRIGILNFYCVKNNVIKDDETESFTRYCELRDSAKKAFYITKGCSRKWMNESNEERGTAGINILWPNPDNEKLQAGFSRSRARRQPKQYLRYYQVQPSGWGYRGMDGRFGD